MAYYNCVLISEDEIKQKYPNLLKDGYTSTDIKTEITSWQEKQRRLEGNSYKYDTIPSENEIYNHIEEKKQISTYQIPITKVISGGQTGVDTIGLQVAKELGIETGGTAPKGFLRETGIDNEDISCQQ